MNIIDGAGFFLAAAALAAQGPTVVGGPVFVDRTLTVAGSPYVASSSILVGFGATLTIEPGVVVEFAAGTGLTVGSASVGSGTLVARGTSAEPVRFTGSGQQPGSWTRLHFTDQAVDSVLDTDGCYVSGSVLEHCIVEFGGGGVDAAVSAEESTPLLDNVAIRSSATNGFQSRNFTSTPTDLVMRRCAFVANARDGFVFQRGGANVRVEGCTFRDSAGNNLSGNAASLFVTGCRVEGAGGGGVFYSGPLVVIEDSLVRNNSSAGVSRGRPGTLIMRRCSIQANREGVRASGSFVRVEDSRFERNRACAILADRFGSDPDLRVTRCSFVRNSAGVFSIGGAIQVVGMLTVESSEFARNSAPFAGGAIHVGRGTAVIRDCVVSGNSAGTDGGGIYVDGSVTVEGTVFSANSAMRGGGAFLDADTAVFSGDPGNGVFNTFLGNSAQEGLALYNSSRFNPLGVGDVVLDSVCWGTVSPNADANRIYDFFDSSTNALAIPSNPVMCDSVATLGAGTPGTNGVPVLVGSGSLASGSSLGLALSGALASSPVALYVGAAPIFELVPSFELVLVPGFIGSGSVLLGTGVSGDLSLSVPIGSVPAGSSFVFQALVLDGGASNGIVSASNGLLVQF